MIHLKRAYAPPSAADGRRILVDRLWPRGLSKSKAHIDLWLKDVAPSTTLRKWFAHDPDRWPDFSKRYKAELRAHPAPLKQLRAEARQGTITLIYAAHDEQHNNAVVLQSLLKRSPRKPHSPS